MDAGPASRGLAIPGIEDLVPIATGGSSVVYRGRQQSLQRDVAVKVVHALGAPDEAVARWQREVAAVARLSSHPNIVSVYDGGIAPTGEPFIVMPYVEAGSLTRSVQDAGRLPPDVVCDIGTKFAGALVATHAAGVLHRDVKPDNVMMAADGEPQLTDFGIARLLDATHTTAGAVQATIPFAAPEVLSGQRATAASDVYSLGATLHFCLTGASPFPSLPEEPIAALVARVASQAPPDLREAGVPEPLAAVVDHALSKDPGARPPSASELRRLLDGARSALAGGAVATAPVATVAPLAPPTTPLPVTAAPASAGADPASRRALAMLLAGTLLVLLVAAAALVALRGDDDAPAAGDDAAVGSTASTATTSSTEPPPSSTATTAAPATGTSSAPAATSPAPVADPTTRAGVALAYFAAIDRGDLGAAYGMLSPAFQEVQDQAAFEAFWGRFDAVRVLGDPVVQEGPGRVTVLLSLDGSQERFTLSLVQHQDGWTIDGPRPDAGGGGGNGGEGDDEGRGGGRDD